MGASGQHEDTPVLIVGGSLVGLSAAVFLAWHRVPTVLVERHTGSSTHPRAIGYTTRTLELFRSVGIELPPSVEGGGPPRRARVDSLAGAWHEEYPWTPHAQGGSPGDFSPVRDTAIPQDRLEPILRARAIELGADIRTGTELIAFDQDDDGVTVLVKRGDDGAEYRVRAQYVVAADGGSSTIRNALGIGRGGRGLLSVQRSILFRAPLQDYLRHGVVQFEIDQPGLKAFLTTYSDGRWVLMLGDDTDRTGDEQRAVVQQAIGRTDVPIELVTTGRWELAAAIAEKFSYGRIFLAGDAAHQLPPNRGGYGANTGIEDTHNLSWKLAAVLGGSSRPELLDTYDSERRPIAWLRHDQIFARADYKAFVDSPEPAARGSAAPIIDDAAMELGQLYRSAALPATGTDLPPARRPDQWCGQPGTRAPHLWLDATAHCSILDEFGRGWVLVSDDHAWGPATARATDDLGVPVAFIHISAAETTDATTQLRTAYGLGPGGAALIRPDGYIAWRARTPPTSRTAALMTAMQTAAMPTISARFSPLSDDYRAEITAPRPARAGFPGRCR